MLLGLSTKFLVWYHDYFDLKSVKFGTPIDTAANMLYWSVQLEPNNKANSQKR